MSNIQHPVVIVTGADRGIGKAIAYKLASHPRLLSLQGRPM